MSETQELELTDDLKLEAPGVTQGHLVPRDAQEYAAVAKKLAQSKIVQKHGFENEGDVLFAMVAAEAIGMHWAMALQNFHVIQGKVCASGQTLVAAIQNSPRCEYFRVELTGSIKDGTRTCTIRSKRKDRADPNPDVTFSLEDAERAELYPGKNDKYGNPPVWRKYPDDQLCWKAAARSARRDWADVIHGLGVVEDMRDVTSSAPSRREPIDITPESQEREPSRLLADLGATSFEESDTVPRSEVEIDPNTGEVVPSQDEMESEHDQEEIPFE